MLLHSGVLAGTAGFGPANAGVKVRCLTAWRRPNMEFSFQNTIILYRKMCVLSRAFCRKRRSSLKNLFFPLTAALKPIRYTGKRYTGKRKRTAPKTCSPFFLMIFRIYFLYFISEKHRQIPFEIRRQLLFC